LIGKSIIFNPFIFIYKKKGKENSIETETQLTAPPRLPGPPPPHPTIFSSLLLHCDPNRHPGFNFNFKGYFPDRQLGRGRGETKHRPGTKMLVGLHLEV
jgi:hypothetical protein